MDPVEIKDQVTEMSEVLVMPVQDEGPDAEGEVFAAFDNQESLEKDISLAPFILEDKDIQARDSSQVVQVKLDLQDGDGEVIAAFDDQESLEKDISLAPVILEDKDIQATDSSQVVQVKLDLQDGDTSLYHEESLDQKLKSEGIDPLE